MLNNDMKTDNGFLRERWGADLPNLAGFVAGSESFTCDDKQIEFIRENKRFWDNQDSLLRGSPGSDTYIVVPFFHPEPTYVVRNAIIAKYLQKRYNCKIIAITLDLCSLGYRMLILNDSPLTRPGLLAKSFGIEDCFVLNMAVPNHGLGEIQSKIGNGPIRKGILSLKLDDIPVGDLIYDNYIRHKRMGTIESIDDDLERYYLFACRIYGAYRSVFDEYKGRIIATVQDHAVYVLWGILARLAHARGAAVFANHGRSSPLVLRKYDKSDPIIDFELVFSQNSFQFIREHFTDKDEERGFQIVNNFYRKKRSHQHTTVEPNKYRHYTRDELLEQLRMAPDKPTVFVMAPVMSDAPHKLGWMLYEDYYQCQLRTLEIIKDIPTVNWIIKDHPSDGYFTDQFTALTAIMPYEGRYQHIRRCPLDLHPGSLIDVADAVVTIRGTAGLEAAVFGKPCVLAGKSPYSGHAIAVEPQTEAEYIVALRALENPKPLSAEAIRRAKALSYLYFELGRVPCDFLPQLRYILVQNIPSSEQWSYMTDRLRDTRVEDDTLYKNLAVQLELNFPHLLKFDKLCTERKSKESPMVSILTICRNNARTIRRCIESVLSQDYPNFEHVIYDRASTDDTLAIVNRYVKRYGDVIRIYSESDSSSEEAFFRGLCKCKGEIIGLCWADDEYLDGAISWGVENLMKRPEAGAIYGDIYRADINGNIATVDIYATTFPWDLEKYLCCEMLPNFCGSFFRSSALRDSGFFETNEKSNSCMYDYYARVGIYYPIIYVPGCDSKFAVHSERFPSTLSALLNTVKLVDNSIGHLMDDSRTPEQMRRLRFRAYAGLRLTIFGVLVNRGGAHEEAKKMLSDALNYKPDPCYIGKILKSMLQVCAEMGIYVDMLDFLNIVRQHNFTVPELNYLRAETLAKLGRVSEAMRAGFDELRLNPEHRGAQAIVSFSGNYSQGLSKLQNGKLVEALFCLNRARQAYQRFPNLEFARATAFAQLGKLGLAKKACEAELLLNTDNHSARKFLERLEQAMRGIPCGK